LLTIFSCIFINDLRKSVDCTGLWLWVCWQLLKGTHRCGRIEHSLVHGQTVADTERVQRLSKHFEHLYADLNPGAEMLLLIYLGRITKFFY